jgi:hypothetical protein
MYNNDLKKKELNDDEKNEFGVRMTLFCGIIEDWSESAKNNHCSMLE